MSALKKCFQVLKVRKRGEETIQHYLLTSRATPTAEQSAAIVGTAEGTGSLYIYASAITLPPKTTYCMKCLFEKVLSHISVSAYMKCKLHGALHVRLSPRQTM